MRDNPNKYNQKWKRRNNNWYHRNTKDCRQLLRRTKEVYGKKFENLGEMDKFLEKYNVPKLDEEEAESLNRPITADKI